MTVVAIIVTYNGAKWIDKCLGSLHISTIPTEVIVIDNASTDNTVEVIENKYPSVTLIASASNLGFGKANNIGLKWAIDKNADYVFLLNQDAWIENDAIEKLIDIEKKNRQYGILSPFHLSYDGQKTETYFNDFVLNHYTKQFIEDLKTNTLKSVYSSQFIHAACWLLPINTIKTIGGFDPLFFHYGEDNDYIQRLQFNNLLVGMVPNAKVYHVGTNEGLQGSTISSRFLINHILLQLKNPSASLLGALSLFFRQYLDSKKTKHTNEGLTNSYTHNFRRIFSIIRSRNEQKKKLAYLL